MARLFSSLKSSESGFRKFALFCLSYNVVVILWGAYVRATGSGAGCGSHWPLCNGVVIPRPDRIQTWIEFAHRTSSGLCLVFTLALMIWALKLYPKGHVVRKAASWSFGLTISEAIIGAALVLFALVEHDQSITRAISISMHLVNTLFLLGALTLTVRFSWDKPKAFSGGKSRYWVTGVIAGTVLLGVTGALTALGDTLFHSTNLASGWASDFSASSHFLIRLRVLHPAIAVAMAALLLLFSEFSSRQAPDSSSVKTWGRALQGAVLIQVALGATNLLLLAPISLQILHLLVADLCWISLVMLCSAVLESTS